MEVAGNPCAGKVNLNGNNSRGCGSFAKSTSGALSLKILPLTHSHVHRFHVPSSNCISNNLTWHVHSLATHDRI